ncbi:MAG: hypothetical protein H6747_09680 [Deltaproteobacteria bacterium]|nr:hypothetical protein [Deltaproteobacteria bacterium]
MNSDIRLAPDRVTVQAWDLELVHPDRRANQSPFRRALVHDDGDRLTINYAQDYPAGTKVDGLLVVRTTVGLTPLVPDVGGPNSQTLVVEQDVDLVNEIAELRASVAALWKLAFVLAQSAGTSELQVAHSIHNFGSWEGEYFQGNYEGPYSP